MSDARNNLTFTDLGPNARRAWALSLAKAARMATTDVWFAWYPVRLGAMPGGRWIWLRKVWRTRWKGWVTYQALPKRAAS